MARKKAETPEPETVEEPKTLAAKNAAAQSPEPVVADEHVPVDGEIVRAAVEVTFTGTMLLLTQAPYGDVAHAKAAVQDKIEQALSEQAGRVEGRAIGEHDRLRLPVGMDLDLTALDVQWGYDPTA